MHLKNIILLKRIFSIEHKHFNFSYFLNVLQNFVLYVINVDSFQSSQGRKKNSNISSFKTSFMMIL